MRRFIFLTMALAMGAFAAVSCGDTPLPLSTERDLGLSLNPDSSQQVANEVARSVAIAMGVEEVRIAIRDEMQESRFHEHKIHFLTFLESATGAALLAHSAEAGGRTPEQFLSLFQTLPDLEFYLPSKSHRVNWRIDRPFYVSAVPDPQDFRNPVVPLYDVAGEATLVDVVNGMPSEAVFFLLPVEANFSRPDVEPRVYDGEGIQGPGECHPLAFGCEGGRRRSALTTTTWAAGVAEGKMRKFKLTRDRDGIGSNEIEIWYWLNGSANDPGVYFAGDETFPPACVRVTGIDADVEYHDLVNFGELYPSTSSELETEFWEDDDQGCVLASANDDLVGRPDNFFDPESGTSYSEAYPNTNSYQSIQWEDNVGGSGAVTDGVVLMEVDFALFASLSGPSELEYGDSGQWTVSVSNGVGPYSYTWKKDGVTVGMNAATYSTTAGIDDFELFVRITDTATGAKAVDRLLVNVCGSPGGMTCPQ